MHSSYFGGTIRSMLMGFALTSSVGLVWAATTSPLVVSVAFQPDGSKGENAAWLGYILARAQYQTAVLQSCSDNGSWGAVRP